MAEKLLKEIKYPKEKTLKIVDIISRHGSDPNLRDRNEPIETVILRDADKMDVFGPIGIARIIMPHTRRGMSLEEIAKKYVKEDYLERKWRSIKTKEAKELTRENYQYSRDYFQKLYKLLK